MRWKTGAFNEWQPIAGSTASTTSHTVEGLLEKTRYTFELRARKASLFSDSVSAPRQPGRGLVDGGASALRPAAQTERRSCSQLFGVAALWSPREPQPPGQVLVAPLAVVGHRVERAAGSVVQYRPVRSDERVVEVLRPAAVSLRSRSGPGSPGRSRRRRVVSSSPLHVFSSAAEAPRAFTYPDL